MLDVDKNLLFFILCHPMQCKSKISLPCLKRLKEIDPLLFFRSMLYLLIAFLTWKSILDLLCCPLCQSHVSWLKFHMACSNHNIVAPLFAFAPLLSDLFHRMCKYTQRFFL